MDRLVSFVPPGAVDRILAALLAVALNPQTPENNLQKFGILKMLWLSRQGWVLWLAPSWWLQGRKLDLDGLLDG